MVFIVYYKDFMIKSKLMKHIKKDHKEKAKKCKNSENNLCKYSESECWFIHENIAKGSVPKNDINDEMIDKNFDKME